MNKFMAAAVAAAAILGAAPAAAAKLALSPQPGAAQKLREANGKPALQSEAEGSTVALVVQSDTLDAAGFPTFLLAVHNSGSNPLALAASNVTVRADDRSLRLYSVEDLRNMARDRLAIAESQVNSISRPGVLGASPRTGYVARRGGGYLVDPNPPVGSTKQVLAEAKARIAAANAGLAEADTFGFKPLVVAPGANSWTGLTLAPLPKGASTLQVAITLGNETHTFAFTVNRAP